MRSFAFAALLCGATLAGSFTNADGVPASVTIIDGVSASGEATELWLALVAKRHPSRAADAARAVRPLTEDERAWSFLVRSRQDSWERETPGLARLYDIQPPNVRVVIGNRGGEDAFTHDATTIGFDVSKLAALYGDAGASENLGRVDRFFRHEYIHLLQKAWLEKHPYETSTALRFALLEIWKEGLGNYYSLSERWRSTEYGPSANALRALEQLEPRLVARLAALACASMSDAAVLTADLSNGKFDQKWGALPVALWLENAHPNEHSAFVAAGPEGFWALAEKYSATVERSLLAEVREAARLCERGARSVP